MKTTTALAGAASTAVAGLAGLKAGLANVRRSAPEASAEPILKINKVSGIHEYGADNVEVEEGSLWAINPLSIKHGYTAFDRKSSSLLGQLLVPFNEALPAISELPPIDAARGEYKLTMSVSLRCVSGEDAGTQVVFKPNSLGGLDQVRNVIDWLMVQIDLDETNIVPVVLLESTSYQHSNKGYGVNGLIQKPAWKRVRWTDMNVGTETAEASAEEPADEPAEETAAETKAEASSAPAAEEPQRRRRRG